MVRRSKAFALPDCGISICFVLPLDRFTIKPAKWMPGLSPGTSQ